MQCFFIFLVLLSFAVVPSWAQSPSVLSIEDIFPRHGGRVDLSPDGKLLLIDQLGKDFSCDVAVVSNQGKPLRQITAGRAEFAQGQNGQPAWHPSGKWIVFQAQNPNLKRLEKVGQAMWNILTGPGSGLNNNLWVCDAEGNHYFQLTDVPDFHGALHPHFSPDGSKLVWAALGEKGLWSIRLADLVIGEQPALNNIRVLKPGDMAFYETHGFSPDGLSILFCATPRKRYYFGLDLYRYEIASQQLERLTNDEQWDEHAHFSPNGKWIVWASSRGIEQEPSDTPKLDYWIMRSDGSQPVRLTQFNTKSAEPNQRIICSDFDWAPDGSHLVAYIQEYGGTQPYKQRIARIQLSLPD